MDHTLYLYQINMKNLSLVTEIKMIPKAELLKDKWKKREEIKRAYESAVLIDEDLQS